MIKFSFKKDRGYFGVVEMRCCSHAYVLSIGKLELYLYIHWHIGRTRDVVKMNWPYKRLRGCDIGLYKKENQKPYFSFSMPLKYYNF